MRTNMIFIFAILIFALFAGSCKDAEIVVPAPPDINDFSTPMYVPTGTTMKLFVNDHTRWVAYVGETFEIKVAMYNTPTSLYAMTTELHLPPNIRVEQVVDNPEYFANSAVTLHANYVQSNTVGYTKVYLKDNSPFVVARGIVFKIRCKAISTTSGFISLNPSTASNVTFYRKLGVGESVVSPSSDPTQYAFTNLESAQLMISDEFYVPGN